MPQRKAAKRIRFTKTSVEALKPDPAGMYVVNDDKQIGLSIRVMPSGVKVFFSYRKIDGAPQRITLGRFGDVSVEQARTLASKIGSEIADGKNPAAARKAKRQELTFGELHEKFMTEHSRPHKRSWSDDVSLFNRYLTPWKNKRLSTITRAVVANHHREIGQRSEVGANRMLSLISQVFNFAIRSDIWHEANPATGVTKFREKSRERFLLPDEMPRFWKALEDEPNEIVRDYLKLSLLLGARRGNMQAMRWDELRLDRAEWRIPLTKNGDSQVVHLHATAIAILQARRDALPDSEWVFPGIGRTGHLVEPKTVWKRVIERAGLTDLRIHDLRRSLGSWMAAAGVSLPVIGKTLGHKDHGTTQIYARLNLDPVRVAVDAAVDAMLKISEPTSSAES